MEFTDIDYSAIRIGSNEIDKYDLLDDRRWYHYLNPVTVIADVIYLNTDHDLLTADEGVIADFASAGEKIGRGNIIGGFADAAGAYHDNAVDGMSEVMREELGDDVLMTEDTIISQFADAGDRMATGRMTEVLGGYKDFAVAYVPHAADGAEYYYDEEIVPFAQDPWESDTWLTAQANTLADAGDVYWDEGLGTYSRILYWEGMTKGGIGNTIEGTVNVGNIPSFLLGTDPLYPTEIATAFGDKWYTVTGGRYEPETHDQAALMGVGTMAGDFMTIPLTEYLFFSRARSVGFLGDLKELGHANKLDLITSASFGPMAIGQELEAFEVRQTDEMIAQQQEALEAALRAHLIENMGVDEERLEYAYSYDSLQSIYHQTIYTDMLNNGWSKEELDAMTPAEMEADYNDLMETDFSILAPYLDVSPNNVADDPADQPIETDIDLQGNFDDAHNPIGRIEPATRESGEEHNIKPGGPTPNAA